MVRKTSDAFWRLAMCWSVFSMLARRCAAAEHSNVPVGSSNTTCRVSATVWAGNSVDHSESTPLACAESTRFPLRATGL